MTQADLRPLSVGEILDRTFTLYRRYFIFFVGITAIPQLVSLGFQLTRIFLTGSAARGNSVSPGLIVAVEWIGVMVIGGLASLFAQGATIIAVRDLYLGRRVSISDCLREAWGEIGTLFGVGLLSGLALIAGLIALILPAIYIFCRLCVAVPAAVIEQRGPQDALSRSWNLTRDNFGRALAFLSLYFVISLAGGLLVGAPLGFATIAYRNDPVAVQFWTALTQVAQSVLNMLILPIFLISTSVFYFDLRVRKEAFDLQFMMDPTSERITPPGTGSVPSIL